MPIRPKLLQVCECWSPDPHTTPDQSCSHCEVPRKLILLKKALLGTPMFLFIKVRIDSWNVGR